MLAPTAVAMGLATAIAAFAAVSDTRSGTIPNWLSLPPLILAPVVYLILLGPEYGLQSLASAFLAGVGPYVLFRREAMGGGDVKLFASLAAVAGVDPLIGVRIQVCAFVVALLFALALKARRGRLLRTFGAIAACLVNRFLPARRRLRVGDDLRTPIRMGAPVLAATLLCALPHFVRAWSDS